MLTDLCGNLLLRNDFINTFCETTATGFDSFVWGASCGETYSDPEPGPCTLWTEPGPETLRPACGIRVESRVQTCPGFIDSGLVG